MELSTAELKELKIHKMKRKTFLDVQESIKICEKAFEGNQNNLEIMYTLGKCYFEKRDYTKLQKITNIFQRKNSSHPYLIILDGHGYLTQGHLVESYKCFGKALSMIDGFDPFLGYGVAKLYENLENYGLAIQWYTNLLEYDLELFKFIEIVFRIGVCLKKENNLIDALSVFQILNDLCKCRNLTDDTKIQIAHIYEKMDNDDKSLEILRSLKDNHEKKVFLNRLYAWIYFKNKQHKNLRSLEEGTEFQDPYILYLIARSYLADNSYNRAITTINKSISLDQDMFMAHNTLGIILYRCKQTDKAIECFRRALCIRPTLAESIENLRMIENASKKNAENLHLKETYPDLNKTKYLDSAAIYNETICYPNSVEKSVIGEVNCGKQDF